jgi:hypothetical protein
MTGIAATSFGLIYGLVLGALGWVVAGYGHGSYALIGLASSPLSLLGVQIALLSPPLIWVIVALLGFNASKGAKQNVGFLSVMTFHYLGIAALFFVSPYNDHLTLTRVASVLPVYLSAGVAWYVAGQLLIWYWYLSRRARRGPRSQRKPGSERNYC